MTFTKGETLEQVTSERELREEFDLFVNGASEDSGAFSLSSV